LGWYAGSVGYALLIEQNVQKLLSNPPALRDFLDREIEALNRLVDRAMKKHPKRVPQEEVLGAAAGD